MMKYRLYVLLLSTLMLHIVLGCSVDDNPLNVEDLCNYKEVGTSNSVYVSPVVVNIENSIISAYLNTQYDENDYTYTHITDFVNINQTQRKDFSEGFLLKWENRENSMLTQIVYATNPVYNNSITIDVASNDTAYKLCNLIPDSSYWVKVVNDNNYVVKECSFSTTGRRILINLSVGFNCRDIGGVKTSDNRIVKYGLYFRGGELDGYRGVEPNVKMLVIDSIDHDVLENVLKIRDVFDYRTAGSAASTPINGAVYHSIPLYSMVGIYDRNNPTYNSEMLYNYKIVLEKLLKCLAQGRPIYAHCQGGCDRTNTMSFLIMGVLGVGENDLALDYELSSFAQGAPFAYNGTGGMIRARDPFTNPYHNSYKNAIEYIKALDGNSLRDKFENFWVNELGANIQQINELREYMLSEKIEDNETTGIRPIYNN